MSAYFALCAIVCLAIFILVTLIGLFAASVAAWLLRSILIQDKLLRSPTALFWLRICPFLVGVVASCGFALPSFLLLEPLQTVESPEPFLVVLAAVSAFTIFGLIVRSAQLWSKTRQISRKWLASAVKLDLPVSIPVYRVEEPEALVAVIGLLRPRVVVGSKAAALLTATELQAAIAHELAHVRSLDNLKRFVLGITKLPRWFGYLFFLDSAWIDAAELAADENALSCGTSALELGAALVKIGSLESPHREISLLTACHLVHTANPSALAMRIRHLEHLLITQRDSAPAGRRVSLSWAAWATALIAYVLILPPTLPVAHNAIEWLVR